MLHVRTMLGLGDAFAARPTIAALMRKHGQSRNIEVFVETPWPEVFSDFVLDEAFVKPANLNIRCAKRNVEESKVKWVPAPEGARRIQLSYSLHKGCKSIPEQVAESAGVLDSVKWEDFFIDPIHDLNRFERLGVFRQPTVRREYNNPSRNCERGAIAHLLRGILKTGNADAIHVNDAFDEEKIEEPVVTGTANAIKGEFSLPTLLDLVKRARFVLSPVSWLGWCGLAYRIPTLVVFGGFCGAETIFGPIIGSEMASTFRLLRPIDPCHCFNRIHDCVKRIESPKILEEMGVTFGEMLV